ncbi:isopenicillin N synthase family dioxygenase [Variovorax sp. N23]|uniref:isopenicillin N synthase family dioxygenase n=1 Tax=Variovorax sp. N23 TaxID=2980555 RepID=UPI0021C9D46F|nr:2-oxoglutarate and iron-dependent oxygenase domain-containing protein [Variovorax sp. N23]MCU4118972.1 isopenicillin N synthase family oxygenase [Variovorax sp. N23]
MTSYLPIIDLTAAKAGEAKALAETAYAIDAVCREHGFFYVVGHEIPQALVDSMFARSTSFFSLSEDVKQKSHVRNSPYRRGYESLGHQSLDPGKPSDLLEAFNIGLNFDPGAEGAPRRGPNQWPDADIAPGLADTATRYMQALESLARQLMRLMAIGLGLPGEYFEASMKSPVPTLRLLHYPPQPAIAEPDQLGCGAHTDWGALTLLAQDACGGLQVADAEGRWHEVQPIEGSFIVNLGDLMARWTNDAYRSTVHRVINRVSGRDRYSLPYFFDIDYFSQVSALPGCYGETNPPKYPTVTAGEHHQEKMRQAREGYR